METGSVKTDNPPHLPKPPWLRTRIAKGPVYQKVRKLKENLKLTTVCEEARCPNLGECWEKGHATFMLFGHQCTRACRFCDVDTARTPPSPDPQEPMHIALAAKAMQARYVVVTSVNRDDLPDGGASLFAETIIQLRKENPEILVELLIPDFQGDTTALTTVLAAKPDVLGHNLETSRRMHPLVRSQSDYDTSLELLTKIRAIAPECLIKSSFMVGLGETDSEIETMLRDLARNFVDIVHIGQYLRPTHWNAPVDRYIIPEQFKQWITYGETQGIGAIQAGPFVRSSYRAFDTYQRLRPGN
jgi:lipoic acid synthetase